MGTNVGQQQFWVTGARFFFERDPVDILGDGVLVKQPFVDLGRIDPVSPAPGIETIQLMDSDGGQKKLVAEEIMAVNESYEIKCSNFNARNQSIVFMGMPPEEADQAVATVTALAHWAIPGELVKIRLASGAFAFGLSAVTTVGTLVQNTDWEVVSLERGIIRIKSTSAAVTALTAAGGNINITYSLREIEGTRLIRPQTGVTVQGNGLLVWGRKRNTQQTARTCRVSLTTTNVNFTDSAFSDFTVKASVLNDLTNVANPAGDLFNWLGALPTAS